MGLAVWRICSLLVDEEGPAMLFVHIRRWSGVYYDEYSVRHSNNLFGQLLLCVWCLSVWVAALVALLYYFFPGATMVVSSIFAMSAIACITESSIGYLNIQQRSDS